MTLILILLLLILLALLVVHQTDRWTRRQRHWLLRRKRLRVQLQELEDVMQCLEDSLPSRDIPRQVNREILVLLEELRSLERVNADPWDQRIARAEEREKTWDGETHQRNVKRLHDSDHQIARTQQGLQRAGDLLRRRYNRGQLDQEELEVYLLELEWAQLMASAVSLIAQGHKTMKRSGPLNARPFYKKAQSLLVGHSHPDSRRAAMIQELGELITGQREALSHELMPEVDFD